MITFLRPSGFRETSYYIWLISFRMCLIIYFRRGRGHMPCPQFDWGIEAVMGGSCRCSKSMGRFFLQIICICWPCRLTTWANTCISIMLLVELFSIYPLNYYNCYFYNAKKKYLYLLSLPRVTSSGTSNPDVRSRTGNVVSHRVCENYNSGNYMITLMSTAFFHMTIFVVFAKRFQF